MLRRMQGMLVARGLRKRFGARTAVDDLSFTIAPGEIYGLLGPNGAGKTTSISMLSGILPRDAGEIVVDGLDLDVGPAARARIGLVPQSVTLYPDLSGRENLRFWGRLYDLRGSALDAAVGEALAAIGLAERADDRVGSYSGGMARRLNLAVGILHRPAVLILDEPTVGVDPQSRSAIFELIERKRDEGVAVLYTTHYMEEAERLCGRIGILDEGRLVAEGTRDALVAALGREARVELGFGRPGELARAAEILPGLAGVSRTACSDDHLVVFLDDGPRRMAALWARLLEAGLEPTATQLRAPDLEDVFLALTGRALRD